MRARPALKVLLPLLLLLPAGCGEEGREEPAAGAENATDLPVPKAEGRGFEDPAEPENNRYVPCPEGLDPKTGQPHVCAPGA